MRKRKAFHYKKLWFSRKAAIASASETAKSNSIHLFTEIPIQKIKERIRMRSEEDGEKLSFTGYIASCLSSVLQRNPELNAFISGNKVIYPDHVTISLLIEREIEGENVPEPLVIIVKRKASGILLGKFVRSRRK